MSNNSWMETPSKNLEQTVGKIQLFQRRLALHEISGNKELKDCSFFKNRTLSIDWLSSGESQHQYLKLIYKNA